MIDNEKHENLSSSFNQNLGNKSLISDENEPINTKSAEVFQIDSENKSEQGQLPHISVEILNEKAKSLDSQESQNNCNEFSLLESREIVPNISVTGQKKNKHSHHKKNKKREKEKSIQNNLIDSNFLLESDFKEKFLCNYIKLCVFPDPWNIQTWSTNLSQNITAFMKLKLYIADPSYMSQLENLYIDKLKEIIISNMSNTISIKSYSVISSKMKHGKIHISEKNVWWSYFQSFYDFFEFLIIKSDESVLSSLINSEIIKILLQKFCSEIQKERNIALCITQLIYEKMINFQIAILKEVEILFLRIIHENQELLGAQEMLVFLYGVISDDENFNKFAYNVLLPLHKVQTVILFHENLMKCCIKYQEIYKEFANPWIQAMIRYWPYGNSRKQLLFLNELDEALKLGNEIISISIWELAIQKLSVEITSLHSKVSALAIKILSSGLLMSVLAKNSPSFPIIVNYDLILLQSFLMRISKKPPEISNIIL